MPDQLAVQLYTLRDFTKTAADFAATLAKVKAMGYPGVQMSAVGCMGGDAPSVTAKQARKMLDDNGLRCCATHRSWEALAQQTSQEIEFHQTIGCDYVAIGGIPGNYGERGAAGYADFIRDAQPVLAKLKAAGLTWGYHNHAHEFFRIGPGPRTAYDLFIDDGGPLFTLEVDTFWVVHAGGDPVRLFQRLHGRVPVIHLKDKEVHPKDGPRMAPIGDGNLNWDSILPACRAAGVRWYAVEQDDCYGRNPFECLQASITFLRSKGL